MHLLSLSFKYFPNVKVLSKWTYIIFIVLIHIKKCLCSSSPFTWIKSCILFSLILNNLSFNLYIRLLNIILLINIIWLLFHSMNIINTLVMDLNHRGRNINLKILKIVKNKMISFKRISELLKVTLNPFWFNIEFEVFSF